MILAVTWCDLLLGCCWLLLCYVSVYVWVVGVGLGLVSLVVFMLVVVGLVGCYWICGLLLVCLVVVCGVSW